MAKLLHACTCGCYECRFGDEHCPNCEDDPNCNDPIYDGDYAG